ncbi:MAG: helix-turn-helix domain-containing protein [Ichthyobacteriaceae bacterium]|nr:helix-turn-helix domain-containing protein [Ichthyobacteriaceae bacterium]
MDSFFEKTVVIKNMVCGCCLKLVRYILLDNNFEIIDIKLGSAKIIFSDKTPTIKQLNELLKVDGFEVLLSKEERVVDEIKVAVVELIHQMNNVNSMVQKSDYLVEKLGLSYQQLSKLFSKYENITLEKFIIQNKIIRIKELILLEEYTLSEIAYMMDYSSVQYLSSQFKKETGVTVTEFKNIK